VAERHESAYHQEYCSDVAFWGLFPRKCFAQLFHEWPDRSQFAERVPSSCVAAVNGALCLVMLNQWHDERIVLFSLG
jgi:hypothetical protein